MCICSSHYYLPNLPNDCSCELSPWAFGWLQSKTVLTCDIKLCPFQATVYRCRSPLLEYLYRSMLYLLNDLPMCMQRKSMDLTRTVVLRISRGYLLKHEYANFARIALTQLCHHNSHIFLFYAHPAHYAILYSIFKTGPQVISKLENSLFSISMWYDMELPMSNAVYSNVVLQSSTILGRLWESIHSISHWYGCTCQTGIFATTPDLHGGGKFQLTYKILSPYMLTNALSPPTEEAQYQFVSHVSHQAAVETVKNNKSLIICHMPLGAIATYLTLGQATSLL
jgi:hypothetical protein